MAVVGLGAGSASAQLKPLVENPNSTSGEARAATGGTGRPLVRPAFFSDMAPGFPTRMLRHPFAQSQYDYTRRIHFGFTLSVGALDYRVISSPNTQRNPSGIFADVSSIMPALGVSALMDYRINHSLSFRLQLGPTFGTRDINFFRADTLERTMQIESVLLEMPILLKYKARRVSNFRPYLIVGVTPSCDVSSFKNFNEKRGIYVALRPFDVAGTFGIGFDSYADFFKFSLELKFVAGMINTKSDQTMKGFEQYPNAVEGLYHHSFVLSLIFE
jgi:hypothetical protein